MFESTLFKSYLVIILFVLFVKTNTYSQKRIELGYVVSNSNDTIRGRVDFNKDRPAEVKILKETDFEELVLTADEIKSIKLDTDKLFISNYNEGEKVFYDVLVAGNLSLLKYNFEYYIKNSSDSI